MSNYTQFEPPIDSELLPIVQRLIQWPLSGRNLREQRQCFGISVEVACGLVGINHVHWRRYEAGTLKMPAYIEQRWNVVKRRLWDLLLREAEYLQVATDIYDIQQTTDDGYLIIWSRLEDQLRSTLRCARQTKLADFKIYVKSLIRRSEAASKEDSTGEAEKCPDRTLSQNDHS